MTWRPIEDLLQEKLAPVLAQIGYDRVRKTTMRGQFFSLQFIGKDELCFRKPPTVEVFASDAYPNDRGEAFLHSWTGLTGSDGKGAHVAEALNRSGIAARCTRHRKMNGVRFAFDPFSTWQAEDRELEAEGEDQ